MMALPSKCALTVMTAPGRRPLPVCQECLRRSNSGGGSGFLQRLAAFALSPQGVAFYRPVEMPISQEPGLFRDDGAAGGERGLSPARAEARPPRSLFSW